MHKAERKRLKLEEVRGFKLRASLYWGVGCAQELLWLGCKLAHYKVQTG